MGEEPARVFNVGAMGVENAMHTNTLTKEELEASLGCKLENYAVLTFHPVTLEEHTAKSQIKALMDAISKYPNITFICTKANADMEGRLVNKCIEEYSKKYDNIKLFASLGMRRYMSALKYAKFVVGNSSSGIIEVPSFHIPTINIGDRQKGRIQAETVINCKPEKESIVKAIDMALSDDFNNNIKSIKNPYGDGRTSDKVVEHIKDLIINENIGIKKKFYDIEFER